MPVIVTRWIVLTRSQFVRVERGGVVKRFSTLLVPESEPRNNAERSLTLRKPLLVPYPPNNARKVFSLLSCSRQRYIHIYIYTSRATVSTVNVAPLSLLSPFHSFFSLSPVHPASRVHLHVSPSFESPTSLRIPPPLLNFRQDDPYFRTNYQETTLPRYIIHKF